MDKIYKETAKELNFDEEIVERAYKSFFEFIKNTIAKLPLKEDLSEEEFNKLRCNFNIPSIGKLYSTYDKYKKVKNQFNYIKKLRENEYKEN